MSPLAYLALGVALALATFGVLVHVRGWQWTGFTNKTLWDWLELMVIPLALAAVAFALNYLQSDREQRREDERTGRARALAADARRENALSSYMQQMSDLLLEGDTAREGSPVNQVMRTSTLTTLRQLDGPRKGLLIQFLAEAELIDYDPDPSGFGDPPKVSLVGADLRDLSFNGPVYGTMNFFRADLRGADFSQLDITATFESADLRGADFSGAHFNGVRLVEACVTGARFVEADLGRVALEHAAGHHVEFSDADLTGADDLDRAVLAQITLDGASLPASWDRTQLDMTPNQIDARCREQLSDQ